MKNGQKSALLVSLIEKLSEKNSWCGETHIQKSLYLLEALFDVPTKMGYVLYKYGPYSFDLTDHLAEMRGRGLIDLQPMGYQYGPKIVPGESAQKLKELYPETLKKYEPKISQVAEIIGSKNVSELEKLATAVYVTMEEGSDASVDHRADALVDYKNHVKLAEAKRAVSEVDEILKTL